MAQKYWSHLELKNGDNIHFVPPAPNGSRLGGITQTEKQSFMPKSQLLDAGIKSISWSTVRSQITVTTVQDIYKQQRPTGTNTRYWAQSSWSGQRPLWQQTYRVKFGETWYDNMCVSYSCINQTGTDSITVYTTLGNRHLYDSRYYDDGFPFCVIFIEHGENVVASTSPYYYSGTQNDIIIFTRQAETFSFQIDRANLAKNELPICLSQNYGYADNTVQKYSNNSSYVGYSLGSGNITGRASVAIGLNNISSDMCSISQGAYNESSNFCSHAQGDSTKSRGIGSHSQGNKTSANGFASHAQGIETQAQTQSSHAQGRKTTASGIDSHAQGYSTISSGQASHAQGYTTEATSFACHSEGSLTKAYGKFSHAQGNSTKTEGNVSHVQGANSQISKDGLCGHAQGYGTVCNAMSQHVQGQYNIKDENDYQTRYGAKARKYIDIVGNGTSDTSRSNAHTLDWSGNAWFSGDVYVGSTSGTNRDEGSVKLAKQTQVKALQDIVSTTGITLSSPDGTQWILSVDNNGSLITTKKVTQNG